MKNTEIFLFNKETMVIGKLTSKMYKPYSPNDRFFLERNFYNLFKRKIYSNGYVIDKENFIKDTIAYDHTGNIYLLLYKEKRNDDFLGRVQKSYDFLCKNKDLFLSHMDTKFKTPVSFSNLKIMVIASYYSDKDLTEVKNIELPLELYTWQTIENILIVSQKYCNYLEDEKYE